MVVHLLNFGHHWILCQRLLLSLRLGHPFHLMRKMVLFLALWMAARRIVQKAFGSLILLLRVILAMIQFMEVLLRPIMQIFFIICSKRLITTMIVWRKMVIVAEIFLRLRRFVIYVNKSRSLRPLQGQEMSIQMQ